MKKILNISTIILLSLFIISCANDDSVDIDVKEPTGDIRLEAGETLDLIVEINSNSGITAVAISQNDLAIDTVQSFSNNLLMMNYSISLSIPDDVEEGKYEMSIIVDTIDGDGKTETVDIEIE